MTLEYNRSQFMRNTNLSTFYLALYAKLKQNILSFFKGREKRRKQQEGDGEEICPPFSFLDLWQTCKKDQTG